MGADLVNRGGQWVAGPRANYRKTIRAKSPEVASVYLRRIYRALFTRPLRSVRVYSVDEETREFLHLSVSREVERLSIPRPIYAASDLPMPD